MQDCELGHVVVDTNRKTSCRERGKELSVSINSGHFFCS